MSIITTVEAIDILSQLGKELVISYTAENKTVDEIVTDLLGFQMLTPAITKGTISDSIKSLTRSIKVDGDTILRGLMRLRDTVGGYISVDNDRKLNWLDSIGEDKGQQIRYRKNLKGIERDIDYSSLVNRLYAYGAGEGTARIKLSDATGYGLDYVEDVESQTQWGGVYVGVLVDKSITHPDTLLRWAERKLTELRNPVISYRIDTVDLSESEGFSFEALQLGSIVRVIDEELGVDVKTTVVKIEHPDLLHPEQMTLELSTLSRDITDTLTEVYDTQQLESHIATTIGAGQVIVKGPFTVQDWVTDGATTIVGSNIEAGTITATQLIQTENVITNTAQIKDGIITNAKITDLSADKITTGFINVSLTTGTYGEIQTGTGTSRLEFTPAGIKSYYNGYQRMQLSSDGSGWLAGSNKLYWDTAGNLTVNANVSISNLTAGTLTVGGTVGGSGLLQSSNFYSGYAGWQITGAGNAEFNSVKIRGLLYGSQITADYITAGTLSAAVTLSGSIKTSTYGERVEIAPGGIDIYGGKLRTLNTSGAVQCSVGSNGAFTAGGGNVTLDNNGITIKGKYMYFQDSSGNNRGYFEGGSEGLLLASVGNNLTLSGTTYDIIMDGDVLPASTETYKLGSSSYRFDAVYGDPVLNTSANGVEGCMKYTYNTNDLYIYTNGAWRMV